MRAKKTTKSKRVGGFFWHFLLLKRSSVLKKNADVTFIVCFCLRGFELYDTQAMFTDDMCVSTSGFISCLINYYSHIVPAMVILLGAGKNKDDLSALVVMTLDDQEKNENSEKKLTIDIRKVE
jgi:hypothetical protein